MASGWSILDVESRDPADVDLGGGVMVPARFVARFTNRGSLVVTITVRVVEGRGAPHAQVETVEVARTNGKGLTPTDPRDVPYGALFDEAVAAGARFGMVTEQPDGPTVVFADPARVAEAVRRLRRRRGRTLTAEHLEAVREVAEAYPRRPVAAVAEAWGVGHTTAAYWVKRARETSSQED